MKRTTIGNNPLDALIPPAEKAEARAPSRPGPSGELKERVTFHLSRGLAEAIRDAVYWTPGLTLAGLAETALREAVRKLERERGTPFPRRRENLKGGRPLK